MAAGEYIGINADWWVVAIPSYGQIWCYMNALMEWVEFPAGDLSALQPALQGPLMNVSDPVTVLPAMTLPRGTYIFHFAVDQMDGILNYPDGPILVDSVTVVVE
ncbi:MAG: hypothetical protein LC725_11305 [Lentisphaerae bacterium]|nr:hypothetical protein [Lentisphaerota bacterium]